MQYSPTQTPVAVSTHPGSRGVWPFHCCWHSREMWALPPVPQPVDDDRETVHNAVLYMSISAGFCPHWSGLITSQLSYHNGEPANATTDIRKVAVSASLVQYLELTSNPYTVTSLTFYV